MIEGLKRSLAGKAVAKNRSEAMAGKLGAGTKAIWQFLDGWKSWIVAIVAVWKLVCASCASTGYADAIINALGWNVVENAFDPKQAVTAAFVVVAIAHRLIKAIREYRAGVALKDLNRSAVAS